MKQLIASLLWCVFAFPALAQSAAPVPVSPLSPPPVAETSGGAASTSVQENPAVANTPAVLAISGDIPQPPVTTPIVPKVEKSDIHPDYGTAKKSIDDVKNVNVREDDPYLIPDWTALTQALIRTNAMDIMSDDMFLDDYIAIAECDIYNEYYKNDFEWDKIRKVTRQSISLNKSTYPLRFRFDTHIALDRYNFKAQTYSITEKSKIKKANVLRLFDIKGIACERKIDSVPKIFQAILDSPINITSMALTESDAQSVLNYMRASDNKDSLVYITFYVTVKNIEPLRRTLKNITKGASVVRQGNRELGELRMDVVLDKIDYFADRRRTVLIYSIKP